jgi:hypothetical protein
LPATRRLGESHQDRQHQLGAVVPATPEGDLIQQIVSAEDLKMSAESAVLLRALVQFGSLGRLEFLG